MPASFRFWQEITHHRPGIPGPAGYLIAFLLSVFPGLMPGQENTLPGHYSEKAALFRNRVEYDSSLHYFIKARDLLMQAGNKKALAEAELNICDVYTLQRNYPMALNGLLNFKRMVGLEFPNDQLLLADYYQVLGSFHLSMGRLDSSKIFLLQAIQIRERQLGKEDTLLHYAYNKMGNLFLAESDYDSAFLCHSKALELAKSKSNPINYLSASSYQNLGIAAHLRGDYNLAERFYTISLKIKELLFGESNVALAKIYNNLGKFYMDLSKYDSALTYYDKAEWILNKAQSTDELLFSHVYINKGNIYTTKGDYEKSISYLQKSLSIRQKYLSTDNTDVLIALMDLGFSYDKKGDEQLAIDYFRKAARNKNNAFVVKVYRNLANTYFELDQKDSANKYFYLSIDYAKRFYNEKSIDLALCYKYYGIFLESISQDEEAIFYLNKSSTIIEYLFGSKNKDLSDVYLLQAELLAKQNNYDLALEKIQLSLISLVPTFNYSDISVNPKRSEISLDLFAVNALYLKAYVYYKYFKQNISSINLKHSLNTINLALYVVEEIRKTYLEEESQIILNNYARSVIDLGVTVAFGLYEETGERQYLEEAFKFSEKGQAIILLSALRGLQARSTSVIPEKISELERNISRELGMYAGLLYEERQKKMPDENKINLWNDKVFYLRSTLDSLHSRIREEYPDFFSLKYGYEVVTTDSALKNLAPDQAILEYYLTDSLIFTFLLTDGQVHGKIAGRKLVLTEKLDSLRNCFTGLNYFNPGEDDFYRLTNLSAELYTMLVRPFEYQIQGKRLIIVPDGELGYLSFDLLLRQKPGTYSLTYQGLPWLILDHPISYSSSATVFFEQAKIESKKTARSLLAFAPTYDYTSHARYAGGQDSILLRLNPITGTEEEVNSIPGSFRAKKFFDEKATESNFKKYAAGYGILHLAMHTLVDNHNPLYSKLVFQVPENNSTNDGYLNTYELFNMKLNGQLAVLSACNTGSGKLERGEGIISLARGFFYAGIPSVVMTLWEIEDHSSADLMAIFYENLDNGLSNDQALQQAKIRYLESCSKLKSHPYFWAGYVNIGKTGKIYTSEGNTHKIALLIALVVFAISGFLIIFFNRRVFFKKKWH